MKRFIHQNGLILDQHTGLMWSQNASLSEFPLSWDEAFAFIRTLNQSKFNGYTDWKLPNRRELFSLLSHTTINPSLPDDHPFIDVFPGYYWTSTSCIRLPDQAWYIHLGGARVFKGMKCNAYMVWPMRYAGRPQYHPLFQTGQRGCYGMKGESVDCRGSGQDGEFQFGISHAQDRFVEDSNTVIDCSTGLIWMKDANSYKKMVNWNTAFNLINQFNQASLHGFNDWSVPMIPELESLLDMGYHSPALPENHPFLNVREFYWSSTTSAYDTDYAWALYLRDGAVGVGFKPLAEFFLWPVRHNTPYCCKSLRCSESSFSRVKP